MSRRRAVKQDSLELLLDTICNTFGGVLFIAIMVVMLLAQSGQGPETDVPVPSPDELELHSRELAALSAEFVRQQQIQASQAELVKSLVPDTIRELIERRKRLLAELARQQAAVDAQQARNAAVMASVARIQAENDKVRADLKAAQQQQAEAKTLLASEQDGRVKDARLPRQRRSDHKREVAFILRYGRLYLWHEYDLTMRRTGLNLRDFVVISDEADQLVSRPRPTAGIPLDDTPASRAAIDKLLSRFDPRRDCLGPIVRPDSYGVFQYFRNRAIALGFEYRMLVMDQDSTVVDRGGSGGLVQ